MNFIFSFISTNHRKKNPSFFSFFPRCSYFFFLPHPRCHISPRIFFLIFRCFDPRALSTNARGKRIHGNVTEREIKASREKIAISRERRRLVSRKRTVLFSKPTFQPPVAGISESDARDNGRGKNADTVLSSAKKRAETWTLFILFSFHVRVHPKDGRVLYRWTRKIFFFFWVEERIDGRVEKACEKVLEMDWYWIFNRDAVDKTTRHEGVVFFNIVYYIFSWLIFHW